jgi:putative protease
VVKKVAKPKKKKVLKTTKKTTKRVVKKTTKNKTKKVQPKKKLANKISSSMKKGPVLKPIGKVTHFYDNIGVVIVKFTKAIGLGMGVQFKGATTDFMEKIVSMQFDHKPIVLAKKNQEIGIKVSKKAREGDTVYEV